MITSNQNRFIWPIVTNSTKLAILNQVDKAVSIYDDSGIFEIFEDKFKNYIKIDKALLFSSGTASLMGAFSH
jgi:perosamine synthetase